MAAPLNKISSYSEGITHAFLERDVDQHQSQLLLNSVMENLSVEQSRKLALILNRIANQNQRNQAIETLVLFLKGLDGQTKDQLLLHIVYIIPEKFLEMLSYLRSYCDENLSEYERKSLFQIVVAQDFYEEAREVFSYAAPLITEESDAVTKIAIVRSILYTSKDRRSELAEVYKRYFKEIPNGLKRPFYEAVGSASVRLLRNISLIQDIQDPRIKAQTVLNLYRN